MKPCIPRVLLLTLLFLGTLMGCQGSVRPSTSEDETQTAASDLPPEESVKRFMLQRVFLAFVNGAREPIDLQLEAGGVQFQESFDAFYGGKARLVSYEFIGSPSRGEQSIQLVFDDQTGGPVDSASRVEETRTYRVVDTGSGTSIERVR